MKKISKKYPLPRRISIALVVIGFALGVAFFAIAALNGWVLVAAILIVLVGALGLGPLEFILEMLLNLVSWS